MNFTTISKLVVMLLLAMALLAACGGNDPTPAPAGAAQDSAAGAAVTSAPDNPPAAQPAQASGAAAQLPGDPKAAILQALRGQLTAGPYRTTTTITGDGFTQTATARIVPPDRMHITMELGGTTTEMIYIGDSVWSKQGDGAWAVSDRMGGLGEPLVDESMIADTERTMTEAAFVGPEVIDGVNALLYTFTTDLSKSEIMPMESTLHTKLWIDAASGRIIHQTIEDAIAGAPTVTEQTIEYDPTITIDAPVK